MPGWGQSWTDNKMFKLEEEKKRQQAVVKKFIADHPEYDPQNDDNNRALVDFIEASKRPFTIETMEWAYQELHVLLQPKKKSIFQKISTALNNSNMSVAPPEISQDKQKDLERYMTFQMLGKNYAVPYYSSSDVTKLKDDLLALEATIKTVESNMETPAIVVDQEPVRVYDKDIAPTKTQRRIKDDDD